ncbi:hypothetical protein I8752_35920 [Nostocaceae cyanobacterium CENA369]|uniref:Uncharacterized protein n=1 Tax=Dendronalium phyllosphericum CENA369 TaxID=1725256 RepID=A0A8J7IMB3_9NOST|nr:hypothetical protein [Dendronalium phyllosphericum]MBH8578241.1 hypothetical protein [Dendronalium phyllosphericum CENA369]
MSKFQPNDENPLIILIGDFGVGKSLLAQRLFQDAIKQARKNPAAPIPVDLKAQQVAGQLQKTIEEEISKLGQSFSQGVTAIIDGADEAGSALAAHLLNEARILVNTWEKTTLVITSRAIPALSKVEEAVQVPPLTENEAYALVERISKQPIPPYVSSQWPESIRHAIRRPLFAVLLGVYLKNQGTIASTSPGDLLSNLVERSLEKARANNSNVEQLLLCLAAQATDCSIGVVSKTDIGGTTSEFQMLLNTGLVVENAGTIGFPLPILTQWFAAQSLAAGIIDPNDLKLEPQRLERWRYPLAIFVGNYSYEQVSKVLVPLVQKHPAFISEIVKEELAITRWNVTQSVPLPLSLEFGRRIRTAMQAWIDGIAPLSKLIAPVREDNTLLPIGVDADEMYLTTGWYCGDENLPDIVISPFSEPELLSNWFGLTGVKVANHKSALAWNLTLNELSSSLSQLLEKRMLPVNHGSIFKEIVWQTALIVTSRGELNYSPISLSEIEECLSKSSLNIPSWVNEYEYCYGLKHLIAQVNSLRQDGEAELHSPWPEPDIDITDGWIWESYSELQLLVRAKAVYEGAIEGYQQLVNTYFSKFAPRLTTAVTLPARFVGKIILPNSYNNQPWIISYWEPLPKGKQSCVDLCFFPTKENLFPKGCDYSISVLNSQLLSLRKEASTWLYASINSEVLDVFKPNSATELAYEWLCHDLKKIAWFNGNIVNRL